jgi:protocadherin-16/23
MVKISVQDVNDNWPVFYPSQYSVNLGTNSQSGKEVVAVRATDPDSNKYGVITYKIVSGNTNIFAIDPSSGIIE